MAKRTKKPSNAVNKTAMVGGPLAILLGWGVGTLAAKNPSIPPDVINAGLTMLGTGLGGLVAWFAKGGRKGEAD
jgi:hypothetical protein